MDLAVASGHELMVVYGRDRKLSLDAERQREVKAAHVEQRQFSFMIRSIVVGDFTGNHRTDIAMLRADGKLVILSAGEARSASQKAGGQSNNIDIEKWQSEDVASNSVWSEGARLVCARVSSAPVDNLVVVDRAGHNVEVIAKDKDGAAGESASGGATARLLRAKLESPNEPEAVLPMRLNSDALGDLVMLKSQSSLASVVSTQAVQTFTITNTNDSGFGSLRQAILDANANPGADTITFNIAGAGVPTIRPFTTTPFSLLPIITEAVTTRPERQSLHRA